MKYTDLDKAFEAIDAANAYGSQITVGVDNLYFIGYPHVVSGKKKVFTARGLPIDIEMLKDDGAVIIFHGALE